jgi:Vacuolar protein sorting-associated protein 26
MDILNSVGQGWLNDIFSIRIYYDADLETYTTIPHTIKDDQGPDATGTQIVNYQSVFVSGSIVSGIARITAPTGRTVAHNGIQATLESTFAALEDISTRELFDDTMELSPAGEITGTVDFKFSFKTTATSPLFESFEGSLFSVRHSVTITILRPWYAFPVTQSRPFTVQRVHSIALPADFNEREKNKVESQGVASTSPTSSATHIENQLQLYGPQSLPIGDLENNGSVVMQFDKGAYELSDHITGSITFSGITTPVVLVKLAVVRIEYADGEVVDSILFDDALLDSRRWRARKIALHGADIPVSWVPDASDVSSGDQDPDLPIVGDVSLAVDLDLNHLQITPTQVIDTTSQPENGPISNDDGDNELSVRYFLRLTLYTAFDAESRKWNAQEIVIYRDKLYGQPVDPMRLPKQIKPAIALSKLASPRSEPSIPGTSVPLPLPMNWDALKSMGLFGASSASGGILSPKSTEGAISPSDNSASHDAEGGQQHLASYLTTVVTVSSPAAASAPSPIATSVSPLDTDPSALRAIIAGSPKK